MKRIMLIAILCFFNLTAYALSDREAFELLSQKSQTIEEFPFHVDPTSNYGKFKGVALPFSFDGLFPSYYVTQSNSDNFFATHKFRQGQRWQCFLVRCPGIYGALTNIDLWVFDTETSKWKKPMTLAEKYSDAGVTINTQSWIVDVNEDGVFDIVQRTLIEDMGIQDPEGKETTTMENKLFIWDKDSFREATVEHSDKINFSDYHLEKENTAIKDIGTQDNESKGKINFNDYTFKKDYTAMVIVLIIISLLIVMSIIASRKGFDWWRWILAGSIFGFIILLFTPSALAKGINEETKAKRRKYGNIVGSVISMIVIIMIALIIGTIAWIFKFGQLPSFLITWIKLFV